MKKMIIILVLFGIGYGNYTNELVLRKPEIYQYQQKLIKSTERKDKRRYWITSISIGLALFLPVPIITKRMEQR